MANRTATSSNPAGKSRRLMRRAALAVVAAALLAAGRVAVDRHLQSCNGGNFSQYPGFAAALKAGAPDNRRPGRADQALLRRWRPRFYLPAGQAGMISFYDDYIASGTLVDGTGHTLGHSAGQNAGQNARPGVTRALLNKVKHQPCARFVYRPVAGRKTHPVVFARIRRAALQDSKGRTLDLTFLTYHAVFARSGLPAGLAWWQRAGLKLIASTANWHQLDHYTAVTVVLDDSSRAVAVMLQQHNYQHTYLAGEGIEIAPDGRVQIDVAISSNELYPHSPGRRAHRAVSFLSPGPFRYMLGLGPAPRFSASDITQPDHEVDYKLAFIKPDDAFYTFQGYLGEKRLLPGRSGPPGASYNTLPYLKPLPVQLASGYWRVGNRGDGQRLERALSHSRFMLAFAAAQSGVLMANIMCLQAARRGCELK